MEALQAELDRAAPMPASASRRWRQLRESQAAARGRGGPGRRPGRGGGAARSEAGDGVAAVEGQLRRLRLRREAEAARAEELVAALEARAPRPAKAWLRSRRVCARPSRRARCRSLGPRSSAAALERRGPRPARGRGRSRRVCARPKRRAEAEAGAGRGAGCRAWSRARAEAGEGVARVEARLRGGRAGARRTRPLGPRSRTAAWRALAPRPARVSRPWRRVCARPKRRATRRPAVLLSWLPSWTRWPRPARVSRP